MSKIKGTDVVGLKKLLAMEGNDVENTYLSKLSESDQDAYKSIIATTWTEIEVQARLYQAAGDTLFPGKSDSVVKLHQKLADKAYSGIYSVFLLIPKASYVFKRAANIWRSYYDTGIAKVENIEKNSMDFVVREYPDLPKTMRDAVTGHISTLLGKTGLKNLNVKRDESNPQEWIWHTTWN